MRTKGAGATDESSHEPKTQAEKGIKFASCPARPIAELPSAAQSCQHQAAKEVPNGLMVISRKEKVKCHETKGYSEQKVYPILLWHSN